MWVLLHWRKCSGGDVTEHDVVASNMAIEIQFHMCCSTLGAGPRAVNDLRGVTRTSGEDRHWLG